MANKKVVGELVYEIRGDDTQYSNVINKADVQARNLGKTVGKTSDNMIKNLAGAYLGWQGLKNGIDATIGSAIRYEDAFAGVRKTVEGTEEELQGLSDSFRELSKEIPITADEFAKIGELAGQLGVPIDQIDTFADTIAKVGVTTNLTTEQASKDFARLANIMQTPIEEVGNIGSAVVGLGNNFATTESEIVDFALRIAGAGKIAGLTEAQVLGIGTALSSVGIEAEAGGTAVQKVLLDLNKSVNEGGKQLNKFATVAGLSSEEFKKAYQEDAGKAFDLFVQGLGEAGDDANGILEELGFSDVRLARAFLSLANAGDLSTEAIARASEEYKKNNALNIEAQKKFKTTASQIQLLKNNWGDLGRTLGTVILPIVNSTIEFFIQMADTIGFVTTAVKNSTKQMANVIALSMIGAIEIIEKFVNGAISLANSLFEKVGLEKRFGDVKLVSDDLRNSANILYDDMNKLGKETKDAFMKAGGAGNQLNKNMETLAKTQTLLKGSTDDLGNSYGGTLDKIKDNEKATKEAEEEAQKLADNYDVLGDNVEDLADRGSKALTELAESNVKDLEKIEDKIASVKLKIEDLQASLAEDLAQQDIGIAEKIVAEERKIEELKKELEKERAEKKPNQEAIDALTAEIKTREDALKANADLETQLSEQIQEARRRADLTDLERSVEDYLAKKAQIQLEFDEKKLQLEN